MGKKEAENRRVAKGKGSRRGSYSHKGSRSYKKGSCKEKKKGDIE